jgi:hypothetical protein
MRAVRDHSRSLVEDPDRLDGVAALAPTPGTTAFNRLQRCYERRRIVIDAYFDLADTIITIRNLIRRAWTTYRWDTRPTRRP